MKTMLQTATFSCALATLLALSGCALSTATQPSESEARNMQMNEAEATQFIASFEKAWSSRDDEDFRAIWHPDGKLVYPFAGRTILGRELPLLNQITKANAPGLTWRMINWTSRHNVIVVEWESSNVYGARTVTWRGVDKITLENGRIREEVVYTDTAPFQAMRRGEIFAPLIPLPETQP